MKILCPFCIEKAAEDSTDTERKNLLAAIASREVQLTLWWYQCANYKTAGHPQSPRYVLDDLPPSARG